MKIYDCFTFYNELDLLDLRLAELYDHVDHFVLVEATQTFQSKAKPLFYEQNKHRYAQYADKIIHVIVDDMPGDPDAWVNDRFQRDCISRGLKNHASAEDIVIIGDADEILKPEVVDHMRANPKPVMGFRTPYFNFRLNYMLVRDSESYCVWIVACQYQFLEKPDAFRFTRFDLNRLPWQFENDHIRMYEHAGWHFTYLGDESFIRNKIQSFAHTELNRADVLSQINVADMIARGVGFNPLDRRPFVPVSLDSYFPKSVTADTQRWQQFIIPDVTTTATEYLPK